MKNILEWLFLGPGQVLIGVVLFGIGCFLILSGVILTLRGLGFINPT